MITIDVNIRDRCWYYTRLDPLSRDSFRHKMFTSTIKSSPFPSFFEVGLPSRAKVTMVTDGYPSKSPLNSPRDFHNLSLFYPILKICFPRERLTLPAVLEILV